MPPYYVFFSVGHTASLQFYHSFFLLTLYSGHRIFLLSYFDTFLTIVFFLLHFMHSTLVIFSLQFYTSWYRPHHMFLTCLSRRNSYPWFLWICTPLSSHSLQSTYVATISLVIHSFFSRSTPLGDILSSLQYSCAFFHVGCANLLFCCTFCNIAIHTAISLCLLLSTSIFGHSYL